MRSICVLLFKLFRLAKRDTEGKATSLMSQTRKEHKTTQPVTQAHFLYSFNPIQRWSFFSLRKSTVISDRNSATLILKLDFWVTVNFRAKIVLSLKKLKGSSMKPRFFNNRKKSYKAKFELLNLCNGFFKFILNTHNMHSSNRHSNELIKIMTD